MASTEQIQQLRQETGAGIMDVKKALEEAGGDLEKAREVLRIKGAKTAAKKVEREAREGMVFSYIHAGGKIGVLLKLYCETDFVARTEEFQKLGNEVAMHIAAMAPQYTAREDIPEDVLEKEKKIYAEEVADSGKPDEVVEQIVNGKLDKYAKEIVLLEQDYIKDQDKTISDLVKEEVARLGENIQVGEFVRYEL